MQIDRKFEVIDSQTGYVVARFNSLRRALQKTDKLDNCHGAIRYRVADCNAYYKFVETK